MDEALQQPRTLQQEPVRSGEVSGLYTAAVEVGPDGLTIGDTSIKAEELSGLGLDSEKVRLLFQFIGERAKTMLGGDPNQVAQIQIKVSPPPHPDARNW